MINKKEEKIESIVDKNAQSPMLKILRRKMGYTLEELGQLSGLSASYISRLESGERRYNSDVLFKLANVLGCQMYELLKTECSDSNSVETYQSIVPVYGVISSDAVIHSSGYSVIDFSEPVEKVARIMPLIGHKGAFAFYIADETNSPRFKTGDLVFVRNQKPDIGKDVLLIGSKNELILGKLIAKGMEFITISHYSGSKSKEFHNANIKSVYSIVGIFVNYSSK